MEKQPVGQLPDLTQSNNDDEIMVITNDEYNQLKKEKISDFITDLQSTNENNALTKGTDGKLFVTDFGNASNITEGTLPVDVLPESGVTADTYAYPSSVTVNAQGQVTGIVEGAPGANNANQDLSNISSTAYDLINQSKALETGYISSNSIIYSDILQYAHSNFDESKFTVVGSANLSSDGILTAENITTTRTNYVDANFTVGELSGQSFRIETPSLLSGTCPNILDGGNYGYGARCSFSINSSNCVIKITTGSSSDALEAHTFSSNVSAKQLALEFDNSTGTYSAFYRAKDSNTWTKIEAWTPTGDNKELYSITESPTLKFQIGRLYGTTVANYKVDLKTLVIKTDTIFTANITGSDTVYINGNNDTGNSLPYVLSKTGSKIADASYRDLIEALYQEQGYAPYYTIDEQNQTFTLPKGEIYGMISSHLLDIVYPIGKPQIELENNLKDNEIWLEGATVSRTTYSNLFSIYGTTYGSGDGSTTFQLPDFRGKVPWGSADGTFGYIEAGLPNITGTVQPLDQTVSTSGCFTLTSTRGGWASENENANILNFNASNSNTIYGNSETVQPPSIKVRVKTRYK